MASLAKLGVCARMLSSEVESAAVGARDDFVPGDDYFAALTEPFGTESLGLGIGPLCLRLDGLSWRQAANLEHRFRPFVGHPAGIPDVRVSLRPARVKGFLSSPEVGRLETYRLESRARDDGTALWSYEFAGIVEPARRRALLALVEPEGPLFERGLENFLRVLTASFSLESGGFLLHASAVVRHGRSYVFFGPSGS